VSELTNPREPWQRLIDPIGSYYPGRLFKARDQAKAKLGELVSGSWLDRIPGPQDRQLAGTRSERAWRSV